MKTAKSFANARSVYYQPEVRDCPGCGARLRYAHAVWRKHLVTLTEVIYAVNLGYKCPNSACARPKVVYRSAVADSLCLKHLTYAMDVLAEVAFMRFQQRCTRAEIHVAMRQRGIPVSERQVQYLYEAYLALLKCSAPETLAERRPQMLANGGMVLSLDGVQPEKGNETLWVVREVLTGTAINAQNLATCDSPSLQELLRPALQLGIPVIAVVSDAQKSIRHAVEQLLPGVPHQLCHSHFLRDIAMPTVNEDRGLKTELKKEIRGIKAVELEVENREDADAVVIRGFTTALRTVLLEDALPPLDLPGVKIFEALQAISQALEECLAKRGLPRWSSSLRLLHDTSSIRKPTLH